MTDSNRRFVLVQHTDLAPIPDCVELRREAPPEPGPGEVLTRVLYLSVDPANRGWASSTPPSYQEGVRLGDTFRALSLDQVIRSNHPDFAPGDIVQATSGWQDYAVAPAAKLRKVTLPGLLSLHISLYGLSGLTAHIGLLDIGRPRPGETVVVSAAAGSVGSLVGQIAKAAGCRVVGTAGGPAKCRWLVDELGFDAAIDYRAGPVRRALKQACPDGVDVYFDNTGGDVLQAALLLANPYARIICCGVISRWSKDAPNESPKGVPGLIAMKCLTMQGLIVFDHLHRRDEIERALARMHAAGQIRMQEDIVDGLENAPAALAGLFTGENTGKRLIRVAEPV